MTGNDQPFNRASRVFAAAALALLRRVLGAASDAALEGTARALYRV